MLNLTTCNKVITWEHKAVIVGCRKRALAAASTSFLQKTVKKFLMGGFFASAVTAVRMCESLRGPRFFKEGWTLKSFEVNKSIHHWANLGTANRE